MIFSTIVSAFSMPLYQPVVIQFGNSDEVKATTNTFVKENPSAMVIRYSDIHDIFSILTLIRSHSDLVIIEHGSNNGILGPNGNIISWVNIGKWINTLPFTSVYFITCNSNEASKFVKVKSLGFSGPIDGILGALFVSEALQIANHNTFYQIQSLFLDRVNELLNGQRSFPLDVLSGYPIPIAGMGWGFGYCNGQFTFVGEEWTNYWVGVSGTKFMVAASASASCSNAHTYNGDALSAINDAQYLLFTWWLPFQSNSFIDYVRGSSSSVKSNLLWASAMFDAIEYLSSDSLPWQISVFALIWDVVGTWVWPVIEEILPFLQTPNIAPIIGSAINAAINVLDPATFLMSLMITYICLPYL